jgi:NAD(P)-dependent dehydrogenase (short-subunit alcohol dehydrogenase family)
VTVASGKGLHGKVAVITGAGSGIGRAAALRFADEGAKVVCVDVSGAEADTALAIGDAAVAVHADVADSDDVQHMLDTATRHFGSLDVLFNNAGFGGPHVKLADTDEALFDKIVAVNLKGVFLGMKFAIPVMVAAGGGAIINTSSATSLIGWKGLAAYSAAKAGVVQMTKAAALEYARTGVRINAICPGMTYTGLAGATPDAAIPAGDHLPTPMRRWGTPAELAAAAVFLASAEASFITGVALPVDGGLAAYGPTVIPD